MLFRCLLHFVVALMSVQDGFSAACEEWSCDARQDHGTLRLPSEHLDEMAMLQAQMDDPYNSRQERIQSFKDKRQERRQKQQDRLRENIQEAKERQAKIDAYRKQKEAEAKAATEAARQPRWISSRVDVPCNVACAELRFEDKIFVCDKEKMIMANSDDHLRKLLAHLDIQCTHPPFGAEFRDGGGSPFYREAPNPNDCYYFDPDKQASDIDCETIGVPGRIPLCYCTPVELADQADQVAPVEIPGPPELWFKAGVDQPCNEVCQANNKGPCDKVNMKQINSLEKLEALLDILQIPCEDPVQSPPQTRDQPGAPFVRGIEGTGANDCYYFDPSSTEEVDCESEVHSNSREPLCLCTEPVTTTENENNDNVDDTGTENVVAAPA